MERGLSVSWFHAATCWSPVSRAWYSCHIYSLLEFLMCTLSWKFFTLDDLQPKSSPNNTLEVFFLFQIFNTFERFQISTLKAVGRTFRLSRVLQQQLPVSVPTPQTMLIGPVQPWHPLKTIPDGAFQGGSERLQAVNLSSCRCLVCLLLIQRLFTASLSVSWS